MSQRTDLAALLDTVHVDVKRAKELHPATWSGLVADQPGWPKAAATEPDRAARSATDHWCDQHSRDLAVCATKKLHCAPTPGPLLSDPTGEAAIQPSRARDDARKYTKLITRAATALAEARRIQDTYATPTLPPGGLIQSEPGCWSCARVGKWVPVLATGTVAGRLQDPRALCKWCYEYVRHTDELPTRDHLEQHHGRGWVRRRATSSEVGK